MPKRTSATGSELFIVDNSETDWKALRYLHDWCQISKAIDIATGYFEIGALLGLKDEWQKVDRIRILMGDEVSYRTRDAFAAGLNRIRTKLDDSLEAEKLQNDFLLGVPTIVEAIRSGKIVCRVYRKAKFHAKAYITHARLEVVGSFGLVGSSNFTYPGLTENIELNVQISGSPVAVLQEWYEEQWNAAEDVTADILKVLERHVREFSPFEVYAKALHELHRQQPPTEEHWLANHSRMYPVLDRYQKDGFHQLLGIANKYNGAFLCDGVGLGKTFVGLMLLEYLIEHKRKRVALIVPKAARKPVWESAIKNYAPHLGGAYSGLQIFNHTDLTRVANEETDWPRLFQEVRNRADIVLVDEAHHFRNLGYTGTGRGKLQPTDEKRRRSRYQELFDLIESDGRTKQVFLLTATPINNKLTDIQHMIELFSRRAADRFKDLGIHSLPGHIRKMEKDLLRGTTDAVEATETNLFEASQLLANDTLFKALIVQRSRSFVRESQRLQGRSEALFPDREPPQVAEYSVKRTYGKLLEKVEQAFEREKPLFSLALYYPTAPAYLREKEPDDDSFKFVQGRQKQVVGLIRTQFLKRFESSAHAFERSCDRLLKKLLTFVEKNSEKPAEKARLERWKLQHKELTKYVNERQLELFPDEDDEEADEDIVTDEMLAEIEALDRGKYRVEEILNETILDLDQVAAFLDELRNFKPQHDDKLKALIKLLKTDAVMKQNKVLIFTEFAETARYLKEELIKAGITGVDQIDSGIKEDRGRVIRRFAPYYNGSSSPELAANGQTETRILISTDVLSEGLNLQDATRLINYDLHWNPVRLMQRIGRVDRRMNPDVERKLLADHPEQADQRGKVAYWNFLPPEELNSLLTLYARVTHKTLRISKTFGIEGKKLLKPDDDYEALKDFNHEYEGKPTPAEQLQLEYDALLAGDPTLAERLTNLPGKVYSGKQHPKPGTRALFFCFALPAADVANKDADGQPTWTEEAGRSVWFLYDLTTNDVIDDPTRIVESIRSKPETPRHCTVDAKTLADIRAKIEKQIRNTYLKSVQAPISVKPTLKAWMELN